MPMLDAADQGVIDLSSFGGPPAISRADLTRLAVRAKSRVKANPAFGWSVLSHVEILAMVYLLDVLFEDCDLASPPPAQPEPAVISYV